jgi:GntR family transcriptional regulator
VVIKQQPGIALYVEVRRRIEELVAANDLRPGDAMPSEAELQQRFGVSRATVRQALATLERRGIVERRQGRGTFLRLPSLERQLPELTSFSEHLRDRGCRPSGELASFATVVAGSDDDGGHFPAGLPLVRAVRVRLANDVPVGLHTVYLPAELAAQIGFTADALRQDRALSLYALLERAGISLAWAEEHLSARVVAPEEAKLIGAAPGTPVMNVLRLTRDESDHLIEVVRAVYLGTAYDYVIHLERRGADSVATGAIGVGNRFGQEVRRR